MRNPWASLRGYVERNAARGVFRKPLVIRTQDALISFTFDDFPRTALLIGGSILRNYGVAGTYYVALSLLGRRDEPSGDTFVFEDLNTLLRQGHELGSHTFSHSHSWKTRPRAFEDSIIQNEEALSRLLPDTEFKSFSYPISEPRPLTKRRAGRHFVSCRGGGQTFNVGTADLYQLSSYFLEKSGGRVQAVKDVIDANRQARGWLILSTHDIAPNPSPYGCTPEFFEDVVRYAVDSKARILPVVKAIEVIRASEP
jgi:peptidoglycan/xylan/chitin deacetylase (PgdA/CDA1 family)